MCNCIKCEECLERQKKYYENNKEKYKKKFADYYQENKDKMSEQMRLYRELNNDALREGLNKKISCECGGSYTVRNKSKHCKTTKHENYEKNKKVKDSVSTISLEHLPTED